MPHLFQNVNISIAIEGQLPFLRSLAEEDRGKMSQYIRSLIYHSQEYQDWQKAHQTP